MQINCLAYILHLSVRTLLHNLEAVTKEKAGCITNITLI